MGNTIIAFIAAVDVLLLGLLIGRVLYVDSDKGPGALMLGFGAIFIFNLLLWLLLLIFKSRLARAMQKLVVGLVLLFLPLLLLLSLVL